MSPKKDEGVYFFFLLFLKRDFNISESINKCSEFTTPYGNLKSEKSKNKH